MGPDSNASFTVIEYTVNLPIRLKKQTFHKPQSCILCRHVTQLL